MTLGTGNDRGRFYFAETDRLGVLCVDQLDYDWQEWTEEGVADLAKNYPATIYFLVQPAQSDGADTFPCMKCGADVRAEADASTKAGTFKFACPTCGLVDHI